MNDWLIDTNLLVILTQPHNPGFAIAQAAMRILLIRGDNLWIAPQTLSEFYSTLTQPICLDPNGNPRSNSGLGYTSQDALQEVTALERLYNVLEERPDVFSEWKRLIGITGVLGNQCYDVRLAAIMNVYNIPNVLTFNTADFQGIPGIVATDPAAV